MPKHVRSEQAARGPHDLVWDAPGAVVPVHDEQVARDLLRQPGFTEVDPAQHGRHEAPETPAAAVDPDVEDDGTDEAKKTRTRKTPVAE